MIELTVFSFQQRFVNFLLMNLLFLICTISFLSNNDVGAFVAIPTTITGARIEIAIRNLHQEQQKGTIILIATGRLSSSSTLTSSSRLRNNNNNCNIQSCFYPTISLSQQQEEEEEEEEEEEKGEEKDLNLPGRRNTLVRMGTTTSLFLTIMMAATVPTPALALRNKNEALCGTGFFEHIYEYKCTSIGDIEDEGTSKKLGQVEINVADNLMAKLGLDTDDALESIDNNNNSNSNNDNEIKKELKNGKQIHR
mmetsp:Transcript_26004/g.29091  ORF Transcript_26004/g.29091 Transcript_26004/m.29091 type:complete len:252 (-) Transcript_26004:731-1486(-)